MQIPNYYQRLGVAETATAEEIKREFRRLAKEFHPDRNPGDKSAEQRFKELSEAYDVLSDSEKRREYDQIRRNGSFEESFRRRGQHRQTEQESGFDFHVDDSMSFEDLFGSLFGDVRGDARSRQRSRGTGARHVPGRDIETTISIPFSLAVRGGKYRVQLSGDHALNVTIPVGLQSGTRIRLAGQGEKSTTGSAGDLFLTVNIEQHREYERVGNDIIKKVTLSLRDSLLGTIRTEQFVDQEIRITIPPMSGPGTRLRLRGMGIHGGDGIIETTLVFPKVLSEPLRKLAELLPD
jgi:DnaJ-class molecular chaperone